MTHAAHRHRSDEHPDERTDDDLVLAVATGDPTALVELRARHHHTMAAAARAALTRRGQGHNDVDDAVQETLLAVWTHKAAEYVPGRAPVAGWLYAATRWIAAHLGHTSHHPERILRTVELTEPIWTAIERFIADDPITGNADRDATLELREAEMAYATELIATLAPGLRATVELVYLRGLSRPAAATALGIGETTLKSRIRRARAALLAAHTGPDHTR